MYASQVKFGKYTLIRRLATGGMAEIFWPVRREWRALPARW